MFQGGVLGAWSLGPGLLGARVFWINKKRKKEKGKKEKGKK